MSELHGELEEQARLLGMSGSREAKLLAKIDRLTLCVDVAIKIFRDNGQLGYAKALDDMMAKIESSSDA